MLIPLVCRALGDLGQSPHDQQLCQTYVGGKSNIVQSARRYLQSVVRGTPACYIWYDEVLATVHFVTASVADGSIL